MSSPDGPAALGPEPEPEPEPETEQEEAVPPKLHEGIPKCGAELAHTNTLPPRSYSGEVQEVMYHGTNSRAAQLIASRQKFLPSATGLLGPGIYLTRTLQKAEGYRTHHPGAGVAGLGSERNYPLASGEPDPGCILQCKVQLGACKKMSRDCPVGELESWHDTPVPDLEQTTSMKRAAMDVRTLSGTTAIRYNSAFSAGCSCCPTHGDECPGSPVKGHRPLPGHKPCPGRCPTGFAKCPVAWSALEEFAVWNTERISEIVIVDGPEELIGYGKQWWDASQAARDDAWRAKDLEFKEWERAHPEIVMRAEHWAAGCSRYNGLLSATRAKVQDMGMDAAASAACAQIMHPDVGGVFLSRCVWERQNGIYAVFDVTDGFPRFRSVSTDDWLYFRQTTCEWVLSRYFPETKSGQARVPCDAGTIPLGVNPWMGTKNPRAPLTIVMHELTLVNPADVEEARAKVAAERAAAQIAIRSQFEGVEAVVLAGSIDKLNGRYAVAADHEGYPHFINDQGMHLFYIAPLLSWRFCPHTDIKPQPNRTLQLLTEAGQMTISVPRSAPAEGWCMLHGHRWHAAQVCITLETKKRSFGSAKPG